MWVLDDLGSGGGPPATLADYSGNSNVLNVSLGSGNSPTMEATSLIDDNRTSMSSTGEPTTGVMLFRPNDYTFLSPYATDFTIIASFKRVGGRPTGTILDWYMGENNAADNYFSLGSDGSINLQTREFASGNINETTAVDLIPDDDEPHTVILHFYPAGGHSLWVDWVLVHTFTGGQVHGTDLDDPTSWGWNRTIYANMQYLWARAGGISTAEVASLKLGWDRNFLTYVQP